MPILNGFADDIISGDSRRPLTKEEQARYSYVGVFSIEHYGSTGNYGSYDRCVVTLLTSDIMVTSASCVMGAMGISWKKELDSAETFKDYQDLFRKNIHKFTAKFNYGTNEEFAVSIDDILFEDIDKKMQVVFNEGYTHYFKAIPPHELVYLKSKDASKKVKSPLYSWYSGDESGSATSITFKKDRLLIDECYVVKKYQSHEYSDVQLASNNCDFTHDMGSPIFVQVNAEGKMSLAAIQSSGRHLSHIMSERPGKSQDFYNQELEKGCGEVSTHCLNTAISATTVIDKFNVISN